MEKYIVIGKIVNTVGLKGMVKILPQTRDVTRFKSLKEVFINQQKFSVKKASVSGNVVNLVFEEISSIEQAEQLKGLDISVLRENAIPLKSDEFFIADLLQCKLFEKSGKEYGTIIDIENYGANDVIFINHNNTTECVPFLDGVFSEIKIEQNKIILGDKFFEVVV